MIVDLRGVLADIFREIGSFKLSVESKFESLTTTLSNIGSKVQQVVSKVDEVEKRMVVNEEKMVDLERNYAALTKRISELDHANLLLKIANNNLGQRERMRTIRFHNIKEKPITGSREASDSLYKQFLQPALSKSGDYVDGKVPGAYNLTEYAHHLPEMPGKPSNKERDGETYILRFHDQFTKESFFKKKQEVIDNYNAHHGTSVKVSQDYTQVNRSALYRLHQDKRVQRITVRGTRLLFKYEVNKSWKEVVNPFGNTPEEMSKIELSKW